MKIRDVLKCIGPREIPVIGPHSHIDDVIRIIATFPHTRVVFVVEDKTRLLGTISVGSLLRHIYPHYYEGKIHSHGILGRITAEEACHVMDKKCITATADETAEDVLSRMAASGVKEIAVIDDNGYILGDITANDLLRHYYLKSL